MASEKAPLDLNALNAAWKERQSGRIRVAQIDCLEDFIKLTTWLYQSDKVIFRGQRCDWPLLPAVGRASERNRWLSAEREAFHEFKREAVPHLSFRPTNNWQWLAVAQHNRLPTRLLDWSKNPLVALWFAVSEPAGNEEPGIVWAHSYQSSELIYKTKRLGSPFSIDRTLVYFPEHVFPYIQAQSGAFTVHHRNPEDDRLVPLQEIKHADLCLTKIEIHKDSFWMITRQLFRLGVHAASLFPGLPGLVERIKYENEFRKDESFTW